MKTLLKILLVLVLLAVVLLGAAPWVTPLFGITLTYESMLAWIFSSEEGKIAPPKNPLLEGEAPKSFDPKGCDELLDLNKFPDTPLNGKLYKGKEAVDVVFKSGQARFQGEALELKLFSSNERPTCQETKADGSSPDDITLVLRLSKSELDKGEGAAFKYGWDLFGEQPLEYYYIVGGSEVKEPLAGLVGSVSVDPKAGGKVKGKGIICFAHPDPNAPPPPKPEGYEEGDDLPPAGFRHAVAGNFEIDFCP